MTQKIAINGFGRIGRLATRIILDKFDDIEVVAVNDITSVENLAYLLKYDSTYRKLPHPITVEDDKIIITKNDQKKVIQVFSEREPTNLPWKELGVDIVIESTGIFTTSELASKHLQAGSSKVVISAPAKSDDISTVVLGVKNPDLTSPILSNASCTTNCISPALKVLVDNFGVELVNAITVHAYTATQVLQDGPSKKAPRDGRAAAVNSIPSTTGAAKAVVLVLPELKNKLSLSAIRIPVITGSYIQVVATLDKPTSIEEVNSVFKKASETSMVGILEYSEEDLVSSDIIQNTHSCIFDSKMTSVLANTVTLTLWYDNEWGYANRLVELVSQVAGK